MTDDEYRDVRNLTMLRNADTILSKVVPGGAVSPSELLDVSRKLESLMQKLQRSVVDD